MAMAVTDTVAVTVAVCTEPSSGRGDLRSAQVAAGEGSVRDGSVISSPIEVITTEKTFREPVKFEWHLLTCERQRVGVRPPRRHIDSKPRSI
jgi:hypothetical protein